MLPRYTFSIPLLILHGYYLLTAFVCTIEGTTLCCADFNTQLEVQAGEDNSSRHGRSLLGTLGRCDGPSQ